MSFHEIEKNWFWIRFKRSFNKYKIKLEIFTINHKFDLKGYVFNILEGIYVDSHDLVYF